MTRVIINFLLLVFLVFLGYQWLGLYRQRAAAKEDIVKNQTALSLLREEHNKLQADLLYFRDPVNLGKELKSRFNYAAPGEKLIIIIIPKKEKTND